MKHFAALLLLLPLTACDEDSRGVARDPDARRGVPRTAAPVGQAQSGLCAQPNRPVTVNEAGFIPQYSGFDGFGAYLSYVLAQDPFETPQRDEFRVDVIDEGANLAGMTIDIAADRSQGYDCFFCVSLALQDGRRLLATSGSVRIDTYPTSLPELTPQMAVAAEVQNIRFEEVDERLQVVPNGCALSLQQFRFNATVANRVGPANAPVVPNPQQQ